MFALLGLFKLYTVSLCGGLYPLPRRPTFRFRNVLHLIDARDRVANVRGVFQRLLTLLGKSKLGYRYPITRWSGQLCDCFAPSGHPFTRDYESLSSSCSVWLTSYSSRVDSAMRGSSISFLTRPRSAWLDSCLGWFLCILTRCHQSRKIKGQFGAGAQLWNRFSYRAVVISPYRSAIRNIA